MRTSTSFATLVALMAVASSAAPIGATRGSARAVVRTFAPPDTKTPESFHKCHECRDGETTISADGVKPLKDDLGHYIEGGKNSKILLDVGKTQIVGANGKSLVDGLHVDAGLDLGDKKSQPPAHPDNGSGWPAKTHGPDLDLHVDVHANDNDKHQGSNGHQGGGKPEGKDACLDPKNVGLDVCIAIKTGTEGGKGIDVIHKETKGAVDSTTHHANDSGNKVGDALQAEASVALGDAHSSSDKTMNHAHDAVNDIHIVAGAGLGSDLNKVGGPYKPALAAVHAEVEGAKKIAEDHDHPVMVGHGPKDQKSTEDCDDVSVTALKRGPKVTTSIIRRILSGSWFA